MVFLSLVNFAKPRRFLGNRGPDRFWRRRRIFSLSGHLYGRHRNCFKFALRGVMKTLKKATIGRDYKKQDIRNLQERRIDSAANEHGLARWQFVEGIQRCLILLSRKSLTDLAMWEPRTFKALTDVAKAQIQGERDFEYKGMNPEDVSHVVRKDLLPEKN